MVSEGNNGADLLAAAEHGKNGRAPSATGPRRETAHAPVSPAIAAEGSAGATTPAAGPAPSADAASRPAAASHPTFRLDHLWMAATRFFDWLSRPRVRLTVTGVVLLLVGGLLVTSSVWTLPLVIAGVLMVVIAWIGGRLDGRFAVEWGGAGTQLEFRARIKAAEPVPAVLLERASTEDEASRARVPAPDDAEVIEGEAHTVEIDVGELKALIAAAEATEAEIARSDATVHVTRSLRVAHGGGRASDAAH